MGSEEAIGYIIVVISRSDDVMEFLFPFLFLLIFVGSGRAN